MEIELGRVFRAIRRFWWVVVASMVAFGLLASLLWTALPKSYTASSTVLVLPTDITGVAITAEGVPVQTYLEMIESDSVLSFVIDDLDLDITLDELRGKIVASNIPGTSMILIQVSDPDAQQAADISNAVVTSFNARAESLVRGVIQEKRDNLVFERNQIDSQLVTLNSRTEELADEDAELSSEEQSELEQLQAEKVRLEQRRADLNQTIRDEENTLATMQAPVSVSEAASAPDNPEGLSVVLMTAVGVVLGALVGTGLMLWLELRDRTVVDDAQVARITSAPILRDIGRKTFEEDLRMVVHFIGGLRRVESGVSGSVSIVAPTELLQLDHGGAGGAGSISEVAVRDDFRIANGVMTNESALTSALQSSGVVIAAAIGVTYESDLRRTVDSLQVAGVPVLGSIVFRER